MPPSATCQRLDRCCADLQTYVSQRIEATVVKSSHSFPAPAGTRFLQLDLRYRNDAADDPAERCIDLVYPEIDLVIASPTSARFVIVLEQNQASYLDPVSGNVLHEGDTSRGNRLVIRAPGPATGTLAKGGRAGDGATFHLGVSRAGSNPIKVKVTYSYLSGCRGKSANTVTVPA